MKRKTKITISALAVMFVAAIAVAIASFSFAGGGKGDDLLGDSEIVADASVDNKTIIDYIIENSHSTDEDVDKEYHIAEITSGDTSTFETYATSGAFKNYVVDGNKTIADLMAEGCVTFKSFKGNVSDADSLSYISNADLIYVSNDLANKYDKTNGNDISEDLYDILHSYATGDYKPLIIDTPDSSSFDANTSKSIQDLASGVFKAYEKSYYVAGWDDGVSANEYLQHQGSLYLGINGETQSKNGVWKTVYASQPTLEDVYADDNTTVIDKNATGVDPASLAKVLTIGTSNTSIARTDELLQINDATINPEVTTLYTVEGSGADKSVAELSGDDNTHFYQLSGNSIFYNAYNNRTKLRPSYIQNDFATLTDCEDIDLDQYDMIIFEDTCFGSTISNTLYKKFAAAVFGKIHIVYSSKMGTAEKSDAPSVPDDTKETVYSKLFYMVATTDYVSRYGNVMITNRSEFEIITTSASASTAKVIADLINASRYRGIGGSDSTSSMFTVLELQPCYPIDRDVAQAVGVDIPRQKINNDYDMATEYNDKGNYYTVPADVVNGKTKEELEENTEYYAWELSKAKIAEALNIPIDKIVLKQMSTEEFACDKTELLGTYDLIYIGGNTSALKSVSEYRSVIGLMGWGGTIRDRITDLSKLEELPIYTMYSHNGDFIRVDLAHMGSSGGVVRGGTPTAKVRLNGSYVNSLTMLNGNDITYNRYQALATYINAGMPVVVSDDVKKAYNAVTQFGYKQNSLDPDSNMCKVLKACVDSKKDNILWGFDESATQLIDSDGTLGNTLTGQISIFNDAQRADLVALYNRSQKRPKLALTSMPSTYNRFDTNTYITDGVLKFKYQVTGSSKYKVSLYIDDDGNSTFDRKSEYMASGDNTTLTYKCADDFFGPLYWMIELVDEQTGVTVCQTGMTYVKSATQEKQKVNVMQILPTKVGSTQTEGAEGRNSLYFCTVCQQAYRILQYNPYANAHHGRTSHEVMYGGNYEEAPNGYKEGKYFGKHEHTFGIVSYDSNLKVPTYSNENGTFNNVYGRDDWDVNLADQVNDLYDFDIDIVYRDTYEEMAQDARKAYTNVVDENGDVTDTAVSATAKQTVVDNFKIDSTDAYYGYYNALTELDDKYEFVIQRSYESKASDYWQKYQDMLKETKKTGTEEITNKTTVDAQKDLDKALTTLIDKIDKMSDAQFDAINNGFGSISRTDLLNELNRVKKLQRYSDYYSMSYAYSDENVAKYGDAAYPMYNDPSAAYGDSILPYLDAYFKAKDKELEYKEMYKKYSRYAAKDEWLEKCYDTVIIGPSEDFAGDDIKDPYALADLKAFIEADKQLLLFHETLTKFADSGSYVMTNTLRSYFGMDRYHFTKPETDNKDEVYVNYAYDSEFVSKFNLNHRGESISDYYFMTNLTTKARTDDSRFASWAKDLKNIHTSLNFEYSQPYYLSSVAYTDSVNYSSDSTNPYTIPYRYAEISWAEQTHWYSAAAFNAKDNDQYGTDKASQNNKGIVTMFPFTLGSELNISGTHPQSYALDIEDKDLTVWYSLAGAYNRKVGSSVFAASPKDGMDNYFIYSYKNVNYCGAGHSKVTGIGKDNNDERYLYINIICNSVRKSVKQPTIEVFDYQTEQNNIIKKDSSNNYYTKVDSDTDYPDFSFRVTVDKSKDVTLSNVKIFYDLDYSDDNTSNSYVADASHILIADWSSEKNVKAGEIRDVYRYDQDLFPLRGKTNADGSITWDTEKYTDEKGNEAEAIIRKLKLQPSYFAPYNNEYTYLVIEATDSAGNKVYQRVKIMIKPTLFDLT